MKIWVLSDLHLDLAGLHDLILDEPADWDVLVLAGDVAAGLQSQIDVIDQAVDKPVVLVAGNHEYWRRNAPAEIMAAEIAARRSRHVRFLERSSCVIDGVRFVGGTLWTDFALFGADARSLAMAHAQAKNADFDLIQTIREGRRAVWTPDDARRVHLETRRILDDVCAQSFDGPTVVVSHHAPSMRSVADEWRRDPGTPAYASRLDAHIERWKPDLWVHGHVHSSSDYRIGETRVVCNPQGFSNENPDFDAHLVLEV